MALLLMKLAHFTAAYPIKLYHAQEEKSQKERITILVGCNSDGSEKLTAVNDWKKFKTAVL